jgi:DNA-binding NarL/FixJ family response regulator
MPQMGGRQLADRLATVRPEARVLFMSGYTDDALGSLGFAVPSAAFVQKPFSPDALAHAVRAALEAR